MSLEKIVHGLLPHAVALVENSDTRGMRSYVDATMTAKLQEATDDDVNTMYTDASEFMRCPQQVDPLLALARQVRKWGIPSPHSLKLALMQMCAGHVQREYIARTGAILREALDRELGRPVAVTATVRLPAVYTFHPIMNTEAGRVTIVACATREERHARLICELRDVQEEINSDTLLPSNARLAVDLVEQRYEQVASIVHGNMLYVPLSCIFRE
jgi:hypothetical protein